MIDETNTTMVDIVNEAQDSSWTIRSVKSWDWFSLILPLFAISPLLYVQCHILWGKQHLQFFPLAWGGVAYFLWNEGNAEAFVSRRRGKMAVYASCVSICMGYASLLVFSSWLAHLSFVVVVWSWALGRFGNLTPLRLTGICGLLLITLPAPSGWDTRLVQMLQSLSSTCCSRLMDVTHIQHIRAGNIIEIPSKPLFVEEACSGVDSQYALMAIAGVWLLLGKTTLPVSIATIITVPIWAILGNLLRIYTIVIGLEVFAIDLSSGIKHTLLGLCTFAIAAFAHWSSVRAFSWIDSSLRPNSLPLPSSAKNVGIFTNSFDVSRWGLVALSPMLILGFIAGWGVANSAGDESLFVDTSIENALPDAPALPNQMGMFTKTAFHLETRDRGDYLGQFSCVWNYMADGGESLIASLDLPFRGWHPLWECYETAGWSRLETRRVVTSTTGSTPAGAHFEVLLRSQDGKNGLLLFSLFDTLGQPYDFTGSFEFRDKEDRWERSIFGLFERLQKQELLMNEPMTLQFQTLFVSSEEFTEESIQSRRDSFLRLRSIAMLKSGMTLEELHAPRGGS